MNKLYRKKTGIIGEQFVIEHLQRNGFSVLAQNYQKQYGEIDIIARKADLLIFVEVKARKNPLVDPAQVIIPSKQRKITTVAKEFLASYTQEDLDCRFDVALIYNDGPKTSMTYIPNAFMSYE